MKKGKRVRKIRRRGTKEGNEEEGE
jgi:hypothetical protein